MGHHFLINPILSLTREYSKSLDKGLDFYVKSINRNHLVEAVLEAYGQSINQRKKLNS